jgi:hypothetical protein
LPQSENSGLISQIQIGNMNSWPADPYFSWQIVFSYPCTGSSWKY